MRSNVLTTLGVLLILVCVVLLGGWKIAVGLLGIALLLAGYKALDAGDSDGS
jgi:hypothetical protein